MSGARRGMARKRKAQREHALERLRERCAPDATISDVLEIESRVRAGDAAVTGIRAFDDAKSYRTTWRGRTVNVVYSPRFGCLRTVLDPPELYQSATKGWGK